MSPDEGDRMLETYIHRNSAVYYHNGHFTAIRPFSHLAVIPDIISDTVNKRVSKPQSSRHLLQCLYMLFFNLLQVFFYDGIKNAGYSNKFLFHFLPEYDIQCSMKEIEIFTDGACSGNPGPGGWACILRYKNQEKELSGGEAQTTNNRMEMMAVISALKQLKEPCAITLMTDSKYVLDGVTKYLKGWQENGWKKSNKKEVLNIDLWQELSSFLEKHQIRWVWVKGHAGHPENERVDTLACMERDRFKA